MIRIVKLYKTAHIAFTKKAERLLEEEIEMQAKMTRRPSEWVDVGIEEEEEIKA